MNERTTIYGLSGPDGAIRYVGLTQVYPEQRLARHIDAARWPRSPCGRWIAALLGAGQLPRITLLETVEACHGRAAERRHIAQCLAEGCDLLNVINTPRHGAAMRLWWAQRATERDGPVEA